MKKMDLFKHYLQCSKGVAAVWFGMMLPMIVSAVGLSVDVGQAYLVRDRLAHALDAAALAAASSPSDSASDLEEKVQDFIDANYPPGKVGFTMDVNITSGADVLYVDATAKLDTMFMRVLGKKEITVYAETEVTKEVKAIEVVLVMDVTGSMATKTNGKTRIQSLKDAAELFVNTMFTRVKDKDMIKIGLVPFSASVNVGSYGIGKTPSGGNYGSSFISNPFNTPYYAYKPSPAATSTQKKQWWGCVLEGAYPDDVEDHTGPWSMYRYCRKTSNDAVTCDTTNANNDANIGCPRTMVTPMTNNKTDLLASISALEAVGNTYINVGLVWGYRMISPEFPFKEGVSWQDEDWKKAIILMTDGVNEPHSYYSAYGLSSSAGITAAKLNNRMLDVCEELKRKQVLVYTITFDKGVNAATKNLFKSCATQPSMWYDAPSDEKLQEVYLTIAKELANLRISK